MVNYFRGGAGNMMQEIKQQIENKLKELFPEYTIYDEDLPEGYQKSSFLVNMVSQSVNNGVAGRRKYQIYFDLSYYAGSNNAVRTECFTVGEKIIEEFYLPGFQIKNKKVQTTDNVLHFTFDTQYITKELKTETIMEKQKIQINL